MLTARPKKRCCRSKPWPADYKRTCILPNPWHAVAEWISDPLGYTSDEEYRWSIASSP